MPTLGLGDENAPRPAVLRPPPERPSGAAHTGKPEAAPASRSVLAVDSSWSRLLSPPEPVAWFQRRLPPLQPRVVLVATLVIDALVTVVLAVVYAPANLLGTSSRLWPAFLLGPALGICVALAAVPYRLGLGPMGVTFAFVLREAYIPWNLATPGVGRRASGYPLQCVDPRTMHSSTHLLDMAEARWMLKHPFTARWSELPRAARIWELDGP
jgi:hypothetical protein